MSVELSSFANGLTSETAFDVLAVARRLKGEGKDVVELQIGDSPFPTTAKAKAAGIAAIESNRTQYCPSQGLPEFREAIAEVASRELEISITAANVVVVPGAKILEQYFCETFLNAGDEVLVFSPFFPTYIPNISRRGATPVFSELKESNQFRPSIDEVAAFVKRPKARAIFLNSPHNPTGGVATQEDLQAIRDLIVGTPVALFSDEPYQHMVWEGKHRSPLYWPELMDQCVAAYTFSKSYSMSGWRIGYGIASERLIGVLSKLANTSLSCVPPFVQVAATAALKSDEAERDANMLKFKRKVELLCDELSRVEDVGVRMPVGTFYVFANVEKICKRLGITSHGLAMYLLEAADDKFGVACLGGECFGGAGSGFLRFSCAEPDGRLVEAVKFLPAAFSRTERVNAYLAKNPKYRLTK